MYSQWINPLDKEFANIFKDSVGFSDNKISEISKNNLSVFNYITLPPVCNEDTLKHSQFFTPADVALYTAYNLLKYERFNESSFKIVFDPCVGNGSLLISAGIVLALVSNLRDIDLISRLHGCEISEKIYPGMIDNILNGLSQYIDDKNKCSEILRKNIKNIDFFKSDIPKYSYILINPPYKEDKSSSIKNIWMEFICNIASNKFVLGLGMIVPVSITCADRCSQIRKLITDKYPGVMALHHEIRPRPLFKGVEQRISIIIASDKLNPAYSTTGFITHKSGFRESVWNNYYIKIPIECCNTVWPKIDDYFFYLSQFNHENKLIKEIDTGEQVDIWIRTTGRYNLCAQFNTPEDVSTKWKIINMPKDRANKVIDVFSNDEAIKWWKMFGDGRDLSLTKFFNRFRVCQKIIRKNI